MLKIAVIFESSPFDRKGLFNAVHNRIGHLLATGECEIDAFCIHAWDSALTSRLRRTPQISERCESVDIDGITYRMLWYDFSLIDYALVEKVHIQPLYFRRFIRQCLPSLSGYDCICAHSFAGGLVARAASAAYGMPYFITWHGSDIHTHPIRNRLIFNQTAELIRGAKCNFFVSEALKKASDRICAEGKKEVLYNGVSESFFRFPDSCREELRGNNGIEAGDKVVAFVGNLVQVKNVGVLQPLFHEIRERYEGPLKFWVVGDGKLRPSVEAAMRADSSLDVSFWGNVPSEHMPSVMNCIDVLVLPSLNEGLPLVCAEAIRSGAAVVGSDVGGIPEVVGKNFVVSLGDGFVSGMASKVLQCLVSPVSQSIPSSIDWAVTAQRELSFIQP